MKIVLFIGHTKPYGGERVAIELARGFARRGHDVTFVSYYSDASTAPAHLLGPDVQYRTLDRQGESLRSMLSTVLKLRALLREVRPDVVLSFMPAANLIAALATFTLRRKVPLVVTEHSIASQTLSKGLQRPLSIYRGVVRLLYRRAARVVAVSKAVAADIAELMGRSAAEIAVIPNPVDAERVRRAAQQGSAAFPWADKRHVLVSVAGLNYAKRPLLLLEVIRRLPAEVGLVMVGDGPLAGEVATAVRRDLADRVHLTGWLDNPHPSMAAADLLVLVSGVEGFGLVVAEAAALDVPAVTTTAGGLHETTEAAGGVVVNSDDPTRIAEAVSHALSHPPKPRFAPEWEPDASASAYLALLAEVSAS